MTFSLINFNLDSDENSIFKKIELAKKMCPTDASEDSDDDCEDDDAEMLNVHEDLHLRCSASSGAHQFVHYSNTPSGYWKIHTPPPKI